MRSIEQFSAREWLQLLPLQHALKQARNDVWLAAYQRRRPERLDAFLEQVKSLEGRNVLLVIAFEQPWVIGCVLRMAARHLVDATVLVFDNSRRAEARSDIERVCRENGAPYLALPMNRTTHVNRSHGMAMSWVYRNVVGAIAPGLFGFIDHDLIPIAPVGMAQRMGAQHLFGLPVRSAWAWQLWAGYFLFDYRHVASLPLNFLYDTGGRNWPCLYRHRPQSGLLFADNRFVDLKDPVTAEPATVQVIDERWLHIGGISYNDNYRPKARLCENLARALDQGLSWQQVCGAMPAVSAA